MRFNNEVVVSDEELTRMFQRISREERRVRKERVIGAVVAALSIAGAYAANDATGTVCILPLCLCMIFQKNPL